MENHPLKEVKTIKIWKIVSIIGFILGFLYSIVMVNDLNSSNENSFLVYTLNILYSISAGIIFFFTFATISYLCSKEENKKKEWIYCTAIFYGINMIMGLMLLDLGVANLWFLPIFPLVYSPFIVMFGLNSIGELIGSNAEEVFQIAGQFIFFLLFAIWAYLEFFQTKFNDKKFLRILKIAILIFIFLLLTIGLKSCMSELSHGF